jgi:DNA-directed RNA polymerase specialized sigma24 family protein
MLTPFARELYRHYLKGESVEERARELAIPVERIEQRLRATEEYLKRRKQLAA